MSERLTICHVVPTLDPAYGGPPVVAMQLAAAQTQLGHTVHMLSHEAPGCAAAVDTFLGTIPHADAVKYHRVTVNGKLEKLVGGSLASELEGMIGGIDVLHLHGVWEPTIATAARVGYRACKPYLVAPHGMLDPYSLNQKAFKKKLMMKLFYRKMLDGAARLHLLNADEEELIRPLGLKTKGVVIANGVHLEEIDPLPEAGQFVGKYPELAGKKFFLFLSRLHHKKGLDYLVEAYADYRKRAGEGVYDLVIAGPDGGVLGDIEARVAEYGLCECVHLVGAQYGADKYAALRDASAFVLTSRQEGFSIAITEALACGLPVLITENCHFPEVSEVGAGYVIPLDHDAIVKGLGELADDVAGREQMGQAGRRLIEERFTWPKIAQQTVDVYREVIGEWEAEE